MQQRRTIRSFVLRQGRMTKRQQQALSEHWSTFGVEYQQSLICFTQLFQRQAPTYLEIGFGMGDATWQIAKNHPENNYLAVEVHRPGVGALLDAIDKNGLTNLRLINTDVKEVLEHMIANNSLAGVMIFFPDPWHKKRHHKRRLIQPQFVTQLITKLQQGGTIHLATDWHDYALQMKSVLSDCSELTELPYNDRVITINKRPGTKFEQRGQRLGHAIVDLLFAKT